MDFIVMEWVVQSFHATNTKFNNGLKTQVVIALATEVLTVRPQYVGLSSKKRQNFDKISTMYITLAGEQ